MTAKLDLNLSDQHWLLGIIFVATFVLAVLASPIARWAANTHLLEHLEFIIRWHSGYEMLASTLLLLGFVFLPVKASRVTLIRMTCIGIIGICFTWGFLSAPDATCQFSTDDNPPIVGTYIDTFGPFHAFSTPERLVLLRGELISSCTPDFPLILPQS